eukprot:gene9736-10772_t
MSVTSIKSQEHVAHCSASNLRYLYNVLVEGKKIILFNPYSPFPNASLTLPPIKSYLFREEVFFNMQVEVRNSTFRRHEHCLSYFPGTLHVMKRSTTHNVYHSVTDNFLALVTTILLDRYVAPDMLHAPRKLLVDYNPRLFKLSKGPRSNHSDDEMGSKHMQLIRDLMSDGVVSLQKLSGTCFRRIVWGTGPSTNYVLVLQTLRRLVTSFARHFAEALIRSVVTTPNPPAWPMVDQFQTSRQPSGQSLVSKDGKPLKVVFFTRGSSGRGRTIANERSVTTLEQQLYLASQADVILGLHGAALVHGVFMRPNTISIELKTLYAYESILFFILADGRRGFHGQVDIRKYFLAPDGHKPIDQALIDRFSAVLNVSLKLQQEKQDCSLADVLHRPHNAVFEGDFVAMLKCNDISVSHPLGPISTKSTSLCEKMLLAKIMTNHLKHNGNKKLHCQACPR